MHPVLFTVGSPGIGLVEVSTYRAAYVIAALVAVLVAWAFAVRSGQPGRSSLAAIVVTALGLPVGARLWHIATNASVYAENPSQIWSLAATGHAMFGGIALASVVGVLAARAWGLDVWRLADASAPGLALGIAIMRVGCFSSGCCFGVPTDVWSGLVFPPGSPSHLWQMANSGLGLFDAPLRTHPTQLYELSGALVCGALAIILMRLRVTPGVPFLAFIGAFAAVRWVNWGFRVHPPTLENPGIYGPIYASVIMVCVALIAIRVLVVRRQDSRP